MRILWLLVALFAVATGEAGRVKIAFEGVASSVLVATQDGSIEAAPTGPSTGPSTVSGWYEFDPDDTATLEPLSPDTSVEVYDGVSLHATLMQLPSSLPESAVLNYTAAQLRYTNTVGDPFFDPIAPIDERVVTQIMTVLDENTQQIVGGFWNVRLNHTSDRPAAGDPRVMRLPGVHEALVLDVTWRAPDATGALPSFSASYEITSLVVIPEATAGGLLTVAISCVPRRWSGRG